MAARLIRSPTFDTPQGETPAGRDVHGGDLYRISDHRKGRSMGTILLILLILLLLGAFPRWGYNQNWGYGPSGVLGLVLVIVLILVLMGHIPHGF